MNKASGGEGIPVELLQILKDDAVKVLHSLCQQIWKTQQWPQDWKMSVFIPIPKKGDAKECSNYCTIALISHASQLMLKILLDRLQQYVYCQLPDVQAGFRKGRGRLPWWLSGKESACRCQKRQRNQRSNCQHPLDSQKSESSRKTFTSASLTTPKPLT